MPPWPTAIFDRSPHPGAPRARDAVFPALWRERAPQAVSGRAESHAGGDRQPPCRRGAHVRVGEWRTGRAAVADGGRRPFQRDDRRPPKDMGDTASLRSSDSAAAAPAAAPTAGGLVRNRHGGSNESLVSLASSHAAAHEVCCVYVWVGRGAGFETGGRDLPPLTQLAGTVPGRPCRSRACRTFCRWAPCGRCP